MISSRFKRPAASSARVSRSSRSRNSLSTVSLKLSVWPQANSIAPPSIPSVRFAVGVVQIAAAGRLRLQRVPMGIVPNRGGEPGGGQGAPLRARTQATRDFAQARIVAADEDVADARVLPR